MELDIVHLMALGLGAVVLCTSHLGVGLFAGYRLARSKRFQQPPPYLDDVLHLVARSQEMHLRVGEHLPELPDPVMIAAGKLLEAAQIVHSNIPATPPVERLEERHDRPGHATNFPCTPAANENPLSGGDLAHLFSRSGEETPLLEGSDGAERYGYPTDQFVAFSFAGVLPRGKDFELVRCKDISVDGISFFLNRRPDTDELVISFGAAPALMFMLAKVVNSRVTVISGRECYRVDCQFVKRLDGDLYRWDEERGVLESSAKRDLQAV